MYLFNVNNTILKYVKRIVVLCLLALCGAYPVNVVVAQSNSFYYEWEQTVFGSGITSTFTVTDTGVQVTGGPRKYLASMTPGAVTGATNDLTYGGHKSSGLQSYDFSTLAPDRGYIIGVTQTASLNVSMLQNMIGQQSSQSQPPAYPYTAGGFYGHMYFELDSNSELVCFSFARSSALPTINTPTGAIQNFQYCEQSFVIPALRLDLMGSTSPAIIISSVTTGVQETGKATWPLLTFIGVPLSFIIGRGVIILIKTAI